mgnify:CR=1 FL=1
MTQTSKTNIQPSIDAKAIANWQPTALPKTPLFGTDGIRGKVGDLLTAPLAWQLGFWGGQVLRQNFTKTENNIGPIIIGQDSRNSSDMLSTALSAGLTTAGLEVWNLGLCPTPAVAYLTSIYGAIGGIMVSASHNPPEDNGIKFFGPDGSKLSKDLQATIEAGLRGKLETEEPNSQGHSYHRPELINDYALSLENPLLPEVNLKGMRIVLDLAWGAAVEIGPKVFQAMGAEIICLHDRPDGDRINVACGSTHLESLQAAVKEYQADLGFAFDGDADRTMAVDSQSRIVDGDYILYLWGKKLKETGKLPGNLIISTVMANLGFERAWKQLGGELTRTAVGDQYVHAEMLQQGAMLGGEQSGHILCPHYGITGDGIMTALHLAALVKRSGVTLSDLRDSSFQKYPQLLKNVRVENRDRRIHWHECEAVQTAINIAEAEMGDRGRILVRASGTEPLVRVMVEAVSLELAHHWADNLVSAVTQHLV